MRYIEYLDVQRELDNVIQVVNQADMQQNGTGGFYFEYRNGPVDDILFSTDPHVRRRIHYPHLVLFYDSTPIHAVIATGYELDSIPPYIFARIKSQLYSHMIARICIFGAIQSRDDVIDRGYPYTYKIMNKYLQ